jgi:hypothetical protein
VQPTHNRGPSCGLRKPPLIFGYFLYFCFFALLFSFGK